MADVLTQLQAGHVFEPFSFSIDTALSLAYRDATADDQGLYEQDEVVPPLAVVAIALGVILEAVALPPGSLHGSESFQCHAAVRPGDALQCRAVLAQRSQRSGWIASVLQSDIMRDGIAVITSRATVLSPMDQP